MSQTARRLTAFSLAGLVLLADQLSKVWVYTALGPGGQVPVLPPHFHLTFVWNRGISFGLLQSDSVLARWGLFAFSIVVAIGLAVWVWRTRSWVITLSATLIMAGAVGNAIDRARYGAVIDFFDFSGLWRPYFFNYVFNIADAAITCGAILLLVDTIILTPLNQRRRTQGGPS